MQTAQFVFRSILLIYLAFSINIGLNAQNFSIETIPNPKGNSNDFVSNPNRILTGAEENELNQVLHYLERETSIEIAVVLVNSIGGNNPHDFGTELFNYWGVGKRATNNGLLVLMVKGQRRIEFITGYGMESILTDIECKNIQQKHMVPAFKAGDYGLGILNGLNATTRDLLEKSIQDPQRLEQALSMIDNPASLDEEFQEINQKIAQERSHLDLTLDRVLDDQTHITDEKLWVLSAKNTKNKASKKKYEELKDKIPQMAETPFLRVSVALLEDFEILSAYDAKFKFIEKVNAPINDQLMERILLIYQVETGETSFIRYGQTTISTEVLEQLISNSKKMPQEGPQRLETLVTNLEKIYTDDTYLNLIREQVEQNKLREIRHQSADGYSQSSGSSTWASVGWIYAYSTAGFSGLSFLFILLSFGLRDPYKKHSILQFSSLKLWMFLFPIPHIGIWYIIDKLQDKYRNDPRDSKKNGKPMHMLSEREENRFLESGQIKEESINSIHYDVWTTDNHDDVLVLPYKTWFSIYGRCPQCSYRTYYQVYNRTIRAATYTSSGLGEKKHNCKHCGHTQRRTYTIPKKQRSSSSSSSSSSGGSWGGGSSGGGGAGSSW